MNMRLVRGASLTLVLPVLLLGFTIARPGPLPPSALPSTFDGQTAARLTRDLARDYPARVPGSAGGLRAALWYGKQIALYGLQARVDRWEEDVPGLGRVTLQNLVTVIPGQSAQAIAIVAHRDNRPGTAGASDNASGTATLVELARPYARRADGTEGVRPLHTLVFVSTDAGAYGDAGARRFVVASPIARRVASALVLDGLSGPGRVRVRVAGPDGRSPAPSLVRTVTARLDAAVPAGVGRPGMLEQAVGLGLRFGFGEQSELLGGRISAVRVGNARDGVAPPGSDEPWAIRAGLLAQLGGGAEAALGSLDQAVALPRSTHGFLFVGDRAVRGWSLQLLLVMLLVPFTAVLLDLHVRLRLRGVRIAPAFVAVRRRLGFWLFAGLAVLLTSLSGAFARGRAGPPPTGDPSIASWPVLGILTLGAVVLGWLVARVRLLPRRPVTVEEEVAGQLAGLVALGAAAVLTAIANPYALVFVAPSLLAWIWLPQLGDRPRWVRDVVYGAGLVAPPVVLVTLAAQLDLGARALLYAVSLATSGVVPWLQTLGLLVWAAAAAQIGAVEAGRYAPGRESG